MTDATEQEEPRTRKVWRPSSTIGLRIPTEEDLSLADKVATLDANERKEVLKDLDMEKLQWDVNFWARPSQLAAINSDKWLTIAVSGRGWGKTWFLAQAIHKKAMENPGCRIALVGRSTSDVRDILIMGESGLLSVIDPKERPIYRPSVRRVVWENGSEAMTFTADIPDQLRGVQFHFAFGDELGSWRVKATGGGMANAWSQLQIATRLGETPQIYIATTPRRVPMIVDAIRMAEDRPDDVLLVRGSTYANRHLGTIYKDAVTGLYAGTSLGSQELEGELLSDVEGALLNQDVINDSRREGLSTNFWRELPKRIVGVDPTVSATPNDECGIVVVGSTGERKLYRRRGYVLEDASLMGSPDIWAARVVEMARKYKAPVVAEDNQGGEMVRMVIQAEDPTIPVTLVKSKAGKLARAEPVAHAYQQGRLHHTDWFPELEDQLTTWAPDEGMKSPDRMDAVVHAITALMITPPKDWIGSVSVRATGTKRHLQLVHDHDPTMNGTPGSAVGRGRNREAILERLAGTRFNVDEVRDRDMTDEEKEQAKKLKAVNRSSRLRLRQSSRHDPYGGPRNRPRL
ncbi:terminase [Gordonia phage Forza]|uniref:Terminase n=1 Tax=Gordonia phage Forza TaxID=2571247 RepID=A0A650FAX9_9CAUD|nr:terminase large subunit [Gordonia phage Forza]QEM41538.1 terminase [Gordonia phage Boopy]QGT55062.1 terminase [Gordonia phage Forza]UXE04211.1 terminase [Gordonia phage BlueNGold]WBF03850.1 terminase [Gordonia phage Mareelih]